KPSAISEDSDAKRELLVGCLSGDSQASVTRLTGGGLQQIYGIKRALGALFVLEIGEHVSAGGEMFSIASDHGLAFVDAVIGFAIAIVGEIGGDYVGSSSLFGLRYAESYVAFTQCSPRGIGEPGFITEFKRRADGSLQ